MQDLEEPILRHIALYRVSLRRVIEELFFAGEPCAEVIERLQQAGRIQEVVGGLPENLSYCQLTRMETKARGLSEHRAHPRGKRLHEELAVLWFACMGPRRRPRLERKPLDKVFGRGPGMGKPHCREQISPDRQVIHRLEVPGPEITDAQLLRDLEWWLRSALSHPQLAPYVLEGIYRFTLLVDEPARATALAASLKERGPVANYAQVDVVPGLHGMAAALR